MIALVGVIFEAEEGVCLANVRNGTRTFGQVPGTRGGIILRTDLSRGVTPSFDRDVLRCG